MAQQSTLKSYNSFVKGIITEAGPLTFPENASLDEENCVLNRDGSRQRRLGMDFESDFVLRNVTVLSDDAIASFLWENAANDVAHQLAVVQVGTSLKIFDATATSISANLLATVDISAYTDGKTPMSADSGLGYLFCATGAGTFYLSFNPSTNAVTATAINLKIRDIFGVDDGLAVNTEPAALTDSHKYNLFNQGWSLTNINAYKAEATINVYPSNAQIWFVGKDSNEDFKPLQLKKMDFGTSPAPKGRYVIDAFARSTSRIDASGIAAVPADIETGRPSVVSFGFERVFWAGVKSSVIEASTTRPNMNGFVFYSRTLRSVNDASQCHTDADPTSEIDSELVETDGGFINIPNSGLIYKLVQKGPSLVVFAEKGIWMIAGDEAGFSAVTHQVIKLSDFGCLSSSSVVDMESALMYWNRGGIYLLSPNDSGMMTAENISENTIQSYYTSITKTAKRTAVGTFDPVNRKVMWMYSMLPDYDGVNFRNKYTHELVLDMVLGAFYKHSISEHETPSPYIAGYLPTPDLLLQQEGVRSRGDTVTKYLTVQFLNPATNQAAVSYSYYRDATFRDWKSVDGVGTSFTSYLLTGYEIMGDVTRNKAASYIVTHFKYTETDAVLSGTELAPSNPSGCFMQAQWDWSNSPTSGKWGASQQVYRLLRPYVLSAVGPVDYGMEVVTNKTRVPGSGKSLSLLFTSDGDKDFYLYGWAVKFTGQTSV